MSDRPTRRDFARIALAASVLMPAAARAAATPGLNHDADAIHQEVSFKARRHRVYAALTTSDQFDAVSKLGAAARSGKLPPAPTVIAAEAGGAFSIFGGYIVGRTIELVPDMRLVQTWREVTWEPGAFSLVKFALSDDGAGTKLVFDHTGFPQGAGAHLSTGWYDDYWDPLAKYLG
ncbi:MAG TPA: SRPBCC domain-containing protein [Rhizomicrobium sp.]|nr:SRPBCC domain-containing protein [Rhizomicrobium sp.]